MEKNNLSRSGDGSRSKSLPAQSTRGHFDPEAREALLKEEAAHLETKAALSARDQFLSLVSHDLKNPITAVSMGLEILLEKLKADGTDSREIVDLIHVLQRNTVDMNRLITDLADAEKKGKEKVSIKTSRQSIALLLKECETLFAPMAEQYRVNLHIELTDPSLHAKIDHDRILQVLSSLFRNAFKYAPPGGKISLDAYSMGREIEFVVSDTSAGAPLEEPFKLFDKFSQLMKKTRKGLGLGLYISKWIVEAHGGKFSIKSQTGQGTTYTFSVPMCV